MKFLIGLGVLGLLLMLGGWLVHPKAPRVYRGARRNGTSILRPPRGRNSIFAAMALVPGLLVLGLEIVAARNDQLGWGGGTLAGLLVLGSALVSGYFFAAEFRQEVRVDGTAVERIGPALRRRVTWPEVARLAYNGVNRWFVLTAADGSRMWVPEDLAGIGDFADAALARLRPEVLGADRNAREALEQIAAEARQADTAG
jgi:hypothetical protein